MASIVPPLHNSGSPSGVAGVCVVTGGFSVLVGLPLPAPSLSPPSSSSTPGPGSELVFVPYNVYEAKK